MQVQGVSLPLPVVARASGLPCHAQPSADDYAGSATVFTRESPQRFSQRTKFPVDDPEKVVCSRQRLTFTSDGGRKLVQLDRTGALRFQFTAPEGERIGEVLADERSGRFFLRTGQAVIAVDADSGRQEGRHDFDGFGFQRRMTLDGRGGLLLGDEKHLIALDKDLVAQDRVNLGFRVQSFFRSEGGPTVAVGDGELALLKAGGPQVVSRDAVPDTLVGGPGGKLWFVEGRIRSRGSRLSVACYDPATGGVSRFKSSSDAGRVVPLHGERLLIFDDRLAQPGLILSDADGGAERRVSFGRDRYLRQFYLRHDESQAYAVLEHYPEDNGPTRTYLMKVDLAPRGFLAGLASRVGLDEQAELVKEYVGEKILPMPLEDGRIVVFKEQGVDLLGPDGTPEGAELPDVAAGARGITLSSTARSDVAGGRADFLRQAAECFKYPDSVRSDLAVEGWSFSSRDGTLNHEVEVPAEDALRRMGLAQAEDYKLLLESQTLFSTVLHERVVPFPELPDARVEVGTQQIRAWISRGDELCERRLEVREPVHYLSALPLTVDGRPYLVAATSDGLLHWHDLADNRSRSFETDGRVRGLVAGDDRIFAVNESGQVMVLAVPGARLLAPVELQLGSQGQAPAPEIEYLDDSVVIGAIEIGING